MEFWPKPWKEKKSISNSDDSKVESERGDQCDWHKVKLEWGDWHKVKVIWIMQSQVQVSQEVVLTYYISKQSWQQFCWFQTLFPLGSWPADTFQTLLSISRLFLLTDHSSYLGFNSALSTWATSTLHQLFFSSLWLCIGHPCSDSTLHHLCSLPTCLNAHQPFAATLCHQLYKGMCYPLSLH